MYDVPEPPPRWSLTATNERFEFSVEDATFANHARRIFRNYMNAQASDDSDIDAAELIFGELTANVARHAPGPLHAKLHWTGDTAWLEVHDSGSGFDASMRLPSNDAEGTRGLFIVSVLGCELTHATGPDGSVVRVKLPVRLRTPAFQTAAAE